jgi:hypothetical protein
MNMSTQHPLRFDLGGIKKGGEWRTVNIHEDADIVADFTGLDAFCEDNSVDEFYLSHALEHVPSPKYATFLRDMLRKLKPGGVVRVVQSDIHATLRLLAAGALSFRAARTIIFPPADRLRQNPFHQHFNMWGPSELAEDFRRCGYQPVQSFQAGSWHMDMSDELVPEALEKVRGIRIPNLGIAAFKPGGQGPVESESGAAPVDDALHLIPRIVHQTWKTTEVGPPFRAEWIRSWQEMNPGWQYRLWTDADLEAFVDREFPDFAPIYRSYDVPIKKVDAARYLILKRLGGVFVDLDFMCLQPLESALQGQRLVFGAQHPGTWVESNDHVCNAFMASVPGHPFWNGVEVDLAARYDMPILEAAGPNFLTQRASNSFFFLEECDLPTVLPRETLYPVPWNHPLRMELRTMNADELRARYPQALAITFWTAVWWGQREVGDAR